MKEKKVRKSRFDRRLSKLSESGGQSPWRYIANNAGYINKKDDLKNEMANIYKQ